MLLEFFGYLWRRGIKARHRTSRASPLIRRLAECLLGVFAGTLASTAPSAVPLGTARHETYLNGEWLFRKDKESAWRSVPVPSSFQSHEGTNFHGIGWYRKTLRMDELSPGRRVLLHFQAAATETEVWWDGQRLGTHLGGWTPFRFDLTDLLRSSTNRDHELLVRLDEKVGHNTQGFLPIITPHFGGLWQEVKLIEVPDSYFDDLNLLAVGDPKSGELRLEIPLAGEIEGGPRQIAVRCRLRGEKTWTEPACRAQVSIGVWYATARVPGAKLWSPEAPNIYELEISAADATGDRIAARGAFRSVEAVGREFHLNGHPVQIRGLLNWGYSPPRVEPNAGEANWRSELEFAKSHGFNLMKFCLWIPPRRYLELADEMGILTWMEYPTWHPDFLPKYLEPLRHEFGEFFRFDRNHPSVVLRSLTCETGPSADLKVIQSLYDSAHALIPGALVEDDSSWIEWNRVTDFYDDHPYGNNHTWVKTLQGFNAFIATRATRPLMLGEAIAADTWLDREPLLQHFGANRPWYAPGVLDSSGDWLEQMRQLAGKGGLESLRADSLRYGLLMRKYQTEAYRREVPCGGYVISVIRDIPNASMGLLDYLGKPKWDAEDWAWQRDTICLLKTADDRRSFSSGGRLHGEVFVSRFSLKPIVKGQLHVSLQSTDKSQVLAEENMTVDQMSGTLKRALALDWPLPEVSAPRHLLVRAVLNQPGEEFRNEWPIWVVPQPDMPGTNELQVHRSVSNGLKHDLFANYPDFLPTHPENFMTVVAAHFDDQLVDWLDQGGRVLLIPDGEKDSLPLNAHWFLRGAPYIPVQGLSSKVPRELLLELQHFDLAGEVVPNVPCLDSFDPLLMLWDSHDQTKVNTHGVIFETRAGQGRLLISAARHGGENNPVGRWLLGTLLEHLRSSPAPRHTLTSEAWSYLKEKLHANQTNLISREWKFRPDPKGDGLSLGWHTPNYNSDTDWKEIHVGAWWESQGYPDLDGWAWYRLWVEIPEPWAGRDVFLSFEGVDDMYELFINGQLAGRGGDLATRQDALQEKKSHNITALVRPGTKALIAVRVYDWYGAGGIFKPVTLGTLPFRPGLDLLK